jgi:hypothetical protein
MFPIPHSIVHFLSLVVNVNYFRMSTTLVFIPYISLHSIILAFIPFVLLVVSYRLSVGPFERLLAFSFFALLLTLGIFLEFG